MCFGLTNTPATFQRLMETVLKGILWKICYFMEDRFVVRTDHSALIWLLSFHDPYDFFTIRRKGMNHGNADGLSRRSCTNTECAD